jgi:hypothetical protein
MPRHHDVDFGKVWKVGKTLFKYGYREYKGRLYRQRFKKVGKKGKWVAVGITMVALGAIYAPAGGFSWLFRMTMR